MIRCVVFDFDGTLVLSNALKREGFFAIAADFSAGRAAMSSILAAQPGDRYAICNAFARHYGADGAILAAKYSAWCESQILVCPERTGATPILRRLRDRNLRIYVNSATPEEPLRTVIAKRYPVGTFDGVLGGHGAKVANLHRVLAAEAMSPDNLLMVGDGIDDRDAATEIGCDFVGVDEGTLAAVADRGRLITDLSSLEMHLSRRIPKSTSRA
jgi:phosphoglycolate phosphatase-like HAD superfamily hydrolase